MPWLINASQLEKFRKGQKNLIILDASIHIDARHAQQEFIEKHIIDAHFFDIDSFSDRNHSVPHMLTHDTRLISETVGKLGIRNDYKIIFYDNSDLHSACRALWMFKIFGHNPHLLYILDGGFKAWEKFGGKIESGTVTTASKAYQVNFQPQFLCTLSQIKASLSSPTTQIIDMRHPVRFAGGPETRPGLRYGHIPGSLSFPYITLFDKEGNLLPLEKIRKKLTDITVDFTKPIITTCGSGLTAPILNFILDLLNHTDHKLYDGSWCEWGAERLFPGEQSLDERPIETCIKETH